MAVGVKKIVGFILAGVIALFLLYDHPTFLSDERDEGLDDGVLVARSSDAIHCTRFDFSDDYEFINIDIELSDSLSRAMFIYDVYIDSISIGEKVRLNEGYVERRLQPILERSEEVYDHDFDDIHSMVLVDLSLSQEQVDAQREVVLKLDRVTKNDNLHIIFSGGGNRGGTSKQYIASKYLLDNNFVTKGEQNYLLRDIVDVNDIMHNDTKRHSGLMSWNKVSNDNKVLFVLSDGELYRDGSPIDPDHYELQQELYDIGVDARKALDKGDDKMQFPIHYINFAKSDSLSNDPMSLATKMRLQSLCEMTGGRYFDSFVYDDLFTAISSRVEHVENIKYRLTLRNPYGKLYLGEQNELTLNFYVDGKAYVFNTFRYSIGLWIDPIIIGETPNWLILFVGLLYMLMLIGVIYILMQVVYPYIKYLIFKRRDVITYSDTPMAYNDRAVGDECYYCKAKFKAGDQVVIKCRHTTHLDCWEENGYKCAEYGERCAEGSFYYNRYNIFDLGNAPNLMRWVLGSLAVAFVVWILFVLVNDAHFHVIERWVNYLFDAAIRAINSVELLDVHIVYEATTTRYLYVYGFQLCFWMCLFLGFMSTSGQPLVSRIVSRLLLSFVCGLCGMGIFFIYGLVTAPLDVPNDNIFIVVVVWLLMSLSISLCSSLGTKVGWLRVARGVGITLFLALMLLLLVDLPESEGVFSEYLQLFFNAIYCAGFAVTFSHVVPASRRYFLRVSGAIKSTEIAIFKWFNSNKSRQFVNLGRSRDCEIHLDWDLAAEISSTHATLERRGGDLYVVAHDKMLFNGKQCVVGRRYRLYDMSAFQIGNSTFTYVEKDRRR